LIPSIKIAPKNEKKCEEIQILLYDVYNFGMYINTATVHLAYITHYHIINHSVYF